MNCVLTTITLGVIFVFAVLGAAVVAGFAIVARERRRVKDTYKYGWRRQGPD